MTTTPDSRIRADWTLPAETAAPPPTTIDTSTTAGKISVLQHWVEGGQIQMMTRGRHGTGADDGWGEPWRPSEGYRFNWERYDYRIAPPPVARTALQRARDLRSRLDLVDSMAADGILCCLLTDIDYAPVVEVLERRISWDAADLSALPKGRYRLVRDDQ